MPPPVESPTDRRETRQLYSEVPVQQWRGGVLTSSIDRVAEEQPVALTYQGIPHVVMLATPADLEDLGVGFTLSEAIVPRPADIKSVEIIEEGGALEIRLSIAGEHFTELLHRRRNLAARSGCGLCGAETIEQAIRSPRPVTAGAEISSAELHAALEELHSRQPLNAQTGSVHAAAWVLPGRGIQLLREDVGRHNALDKVIGALVRAHIDPTCGYLIITSRASYEMVQKTATLGIGLLAAVSAPTAMGVRLAEQTGLTLIGFARTQQHVVYAHPRRLRD